MPAVLDTNSRLSRMKLSRIILLAFVVCAFLYLIDCMALSFAAEHTAAFVANVAVPFDLMICVPVAFYLLLVRPRRLSPLLVLPIIYLGGIVSSQLSVPGSFSLLPLLFAAAGAIDIIVAAFEVPRLMRTFAVGYREAKAESGCAVEWFERGTASILGANTPSRLAALEMSIWYYTIFSWRADPDVPEGSRAFTCYKDTGFLAFSGVIMALFPIEAAVVHVLVMQWSPIAALILTFATAYLLVWMLGTTRAVVLNPILVDEDALTIRWGAHFRVRIPLKAIDCFFSEVPNVPKGQRVNMGVMGADPCWVLLKTPVVLPTIFGRPREVSAINISPDEKAKFKKAVLGGR